MTREFDVTLAGYYGFGNLGDELLARSAVYFLQNAGISTERLAILSASPESSSKELGIRAFNRWNFLDVHKALKSSRSLLLGGGGLFQDSTSTKSCLYYCGLVTLAKICGARPWAVGQSIGPLRSRTARWLAKHAFASCVFRGVRDAKSLEQLCAWRLDGVRMPDLVMGLEVRRNAGHRGAMLLNLRPGYDSLAEYAADKARRFAQDSGLPVIGVALSEADERLLKSFASKNIIKLDELVLINTPQNFEAIAANAVCAVGMRLHFLILSLLSGMQVCAIPYDPKVNSLALEYNIPVVDENHAGIEFSDAQNGTVASGATEKLAGIFRRGVKAVLEEI